MKTIDEKLVIIDLIIDVESKINFIGFRSPKIMFLVNVSVLVKSNRQYLTSTEKGLKKISGPLDLTT